MIRYLRLPLSWIARSDRVGIPLMRVYSSVTAGSRSGCQSS